MTQEHLSSLTTKYRGIVGFSLPDTSRSGYMGSTSSTFVWMVLISSFTSVYADCPPRKFKCPDGECVLLTELCSNGCPPLHKLKLCLESRTCVGTHMKCPTPCKPLTERLCFDHSCVGKDEYCTTELCPSWKENRCPGYNGGSFCYSESQICNGITECSNSIDEQLCSRKNAGIRSGWPKLLTYIAVPMIVLLAMFGTCCKYAKYTRKKSERSEGPAPLEGDPQSGTPDYMRTWYDLYVTSPNTGTSRDDMPLSRHLIDRMSRNGPPIPLSPRGPLGNGTADFGSGNVGLFGSLNRNDQETNLSINVQNPALSHQGDLFNPEENPSSLDPPDYDDALQSCYSPPSYSENDVQPAESDGLPTYEEVLNRTSIV